uniref:Uncharacterized protein n=1 Tax=Terrapene triunguis TaxID=2587831 RepID=A0A674J615_9SAUR
SMVCVCYTFLCITCSVRVHCTVCALHVVCMCVTLCVCLLHTLYVCYSVFHALCLCTCVGVTLYYTLCVCTHVGVIVCYMLCAHVWVLDSVCYIHCVCARVCVLHSMSYVLCACTGLGVTLCDKCFLCAHAWLLHSVLHAVCVGYTVHTCGYYTPCVTRCGCAHVWVLHSVCYTVCMCASVWVEAPRRPGAARGTRWRGEEPGKRPAPQAGTHPRGPVSPAQGIVGGVVSPTQGIVGGAVPLAAPQPWGWVGWCRAQFSHRPLCLLGPWWGRATNPAGEGGGRACMGTARDVGGIRIEIWGV